MFAYNVSVLMAQLMHVVSTTESHTAHRGSFVRQSVLTYFNKLNRSKMMYFISIYLYYNTNYNDSLTFTLTSLFFPASSQLICHSSTVCSIVGINNKQTTINKLKLTKSIVINIILILIAIIYLNTLWIIKS